MALYNISPAPWNTINLQLGLIVNFTIPSLSLSAFQLLWSPDILVFIAENKDIP